MPRLLGYRERLPANFYDTLIYQGQICSDPRGPRTARLFDDNRRIGLSAQTNMQIPGQMSSDSTFVIGNWYARTTLPDSPEFRRFAHESFAEIRIGVFTHSRISIADLLARKEGMRLGPQRDEEIANGQFEQVASKFAQIMMSRYADFNPGFTVKPNDWNEAARDALRAAESVSGPLARPLIVPARQNFGVRVDINAPDALADALGTCLGASLFVHIEGLLSRDVG